MLGEYVLTQADLQQTRMKPDAIGLAGYNIDIREVQWLSHAVYRFPAVQNQVFTEGYLSQPVDPWQIPYRALLPKANQASNLLVTSCISASTIAYASFRVEPTYMVAGESAGIAAALSIQSKTDLHHIDMTRLQEILRSRGQILSANASPTQRSGK
jgi:FAD dependent oxidoreductase